MRALALSLALSPPLSLFALLSLSQCALPLSSTLAVLANLMRNLIPTLAALKHVLEQVARPFSLCLSLFIYNCICVFLSLSIYIYIYLCLCIYVFMYIYKYRYICIYT